MDEILFYIILKNIAIFLTLSLMILTYVYNFPKIYINKQILSLGLIFLFISFILNVKLLRNNPNTEPYHKIPNLLFLIQTILSIYMLNMLLFKK